MNVLFIASAYPADPDDPRGIFVHRLGRGLVAEGLTVKVVAPGSGSSTVVHILDGVEVHRVPYWRGDGPRLASGLGGIVPNLRRQPWLVLQVPVLMASLARTAARLAHGADVVHAHWLYPGGIAGAYAARRASVPLVVTSHGGDLNLAARVPPLKMLSTRVARSAARCIGVSTSLVDDFASLGVPRDRISFVPYGVDLPPEGTATNGFVEAEPWLGPDALRVLYLGSLIPRKSVETLIEAHAELEKRGRPLSTAIVGGGPSEPELRKLAADLSLKQVTFVGEQPPSRVERWMRLADVIVLPSLSEGRPNVVLEALAAGRPVVATRIPGTSELVQDGVTGRLFGVGSATELADCLDGFVSDRSLTEAMGGAGRRWVVSEGLTTEQIARKHVALYESVTAAR